MEKTKSLDLDKAVRNAQLETGEVFNADTKSYNKEACRVYNIAVEGLYEMEYYIREGKTYNFLIDCGIIVHEIAPSYYLILKSARAKNPTYFVIGKYRTAYKEFASILCDKEGKVITIDADGAWHNEPD